MTQSAHIETSPPAFPKPPGPMTYEEFLAWAPEGLRAEWVNGEAVLMSPSSDFHQDLAIWLAALLRFMVDAKKLGKILGGPYQMKGKGGLPGREPDLIFVSTKNLGRIKRNHLDGPADVAIEIISPESRVRDRGEKFYEYEQSGVTEYWILDPQRKQAEFHRLGDDGVYRPMALEGGDIFRGVELPGFWLRTAWLWEEPLPPVPVVLRELGLI